MARFAWIECPACRGVYVRLADPAFAPVDGVTPLRAADYLRADGTPHADGDAIGACQTCGAPGPPDLFGAGNIRRGDALPAREAGPRWAT